MKTTQPTHKKLPRARVFVADYDASYPADVRFETYETMADQKDNRPDLAGFHVAFIPTRTKREAEQIVKAAEFLRLPEEEKVEIVAKWLNSEASGKEFRPFFMEVDRRRAKSLLAAMGMGGASK